LDAFDEIVVIASQIPLSRRRIGTSVSSLGEEDIRAHGNFALSDILRQLPAVAASTAGGVGQPVSLRIRGEEGFRTLLLYDGMRLSDPSTPQIAPRFDQVLSSHVGQVELLRGPQGLSYGADAGGVVSITSPASDKVLAGSLDLQTGTFGTRQLAGQVNGRQDRTDYHVAVTDFRSDGFNARISDAAADKDGYENTTWHGRLLRELNDSWSLGLVSRHTRGTGQFDGCGFPTVHDCVADYALDATRLSVHYDGAGGSHTLAFASTDTDRQSYTAGTAAFGANGTLQRWEYLGNTTPWRSLGLVWGADLESADSGSRQRDNRGLHLEMLSDLSTRWFLSAGLRHDDNEDFGSHTGYRVSAAWLAMPSAGYQLKLRGSLGSGFRAPSLYEVEYNSGPWAYAPAADVRLREETSRGWELGLELAAGTAWQSAIVYFDQQVENAISFDLAGYSGYLQEPGGSRSSGVELSGRWQAGERLGLQANITFNDATRPNGQPRIQRPRRQANGGIDYRSPSGRLLVHGYYRSARDAVDEVFGGSAPIPLDDHGVLDLGATLQLGTGVTLSLRVENALDEDFREVVDYNNPPRAVYVGASLGF
jgi:vitamin B12 transporter